MPIILIQSEESYNIDETVFTYRRLQYRQQAELQHLYTVRGELDAVTYAQMCIAVALTGWKELYGMNGPVEWPALATSLVGQSENLLLVSPERQAQLEVIYAVVEALPREVALELGQRVNSLAPDELKKSWVITSTGVSSSPTAVPGLSLPADDAALTTPMTANDLPATDQG